MPYFSCKGLTVALWLRARPLAIAAASPGAVATQLEALGAGVACLVAHQPATTGVHHPIDGIWQLCTAHCEEGEEERRRKGKREALKSMERGNYGCETHVCTVAQSLSTVCQLGRSWSRSPPARIPGHTCRWLGSPGHCHCSGPPHHWEGQEELGTPLDHRPHSLQIEGEKWRYTTRKKQGVGVL